MTIRVVLLVCTVALIGGCVTAPKASKQEVAAVNLQLGVGYLRQGELEVAMDKLQKALEAQPQRPDIHGAVALAYEQMGKAEQADEHYRRAIELAPEGTAQSGAAHNNYGAFLCRYNRLDEAETYFLRAIANKRYSTPEAAYENIGLCALGMPDTEKAELAFRRALQANPRLPVSLFEMARIQFDKGNFLQSRAFIQRFHDVSPVKPESLYLGVRVERGLGDEKAASRYARLLQTTFPESDEAGMINETDEAQEVR